MIIFVFVEIAQIGSAAIGADLVICRRLPIPSIWAIYSPSIEYGDPYRVFRAGEGAAHAP